MWTMLRKLAALIISGCDGAVGFQATEETLDVVSLWFRSL
jgi:hypothetical protein